MADEDEDLTLLDKLRRKHSDAVNALAALVDTRGEERDAFEQRTASQDDKPSDEEQRTYAAAEEAFNDDFKAKRSAITALDRRIAEQEVVEERRQVAARASSTGVTGISREPMTYRRDNAARVGDDNPTRHSYFRDLAAIQLRRVDDRLGDPVQARERLEQHGREMRSYMDARRDAMAERGQAQIGRAHV